MPSGRRPRPRVRHRLHREHASGAWRLRHPEVGTDGTLTSTGSRHAGRRGGRRLPRDRVLGTKPGRADRLRATASQTYTTCGPAINRVRPDGDRGRLGGNADRWVGLSRQLRRGALGECLAQLVARGDSQLVEDLAQMVSNRVLADDEPGADLGVREPISGELAICHSWAVRSSRVSTARLRAFSPVAVSSLRARSARLACQST